MRYRIKADYNLRSTAIRPSGPLEGMLTYRTEPPAHCPECGYCLILHEHPEGGWDCRCLRYDPLEGGGPHLCTERFRTVDLLLQALPTELEAIRLIRAL